MKSRIIITALLISLVMQVHADGLFNRSDYSYYHDRFGNTISEEGAIAGATAAGLGVGCVVGGIMYLKQIRKNTSLLVGGISALASGIIAYSLLSSYTPQTQYLMLEKLFGDIAKRRLFSVDFSNHDTALTSIAALYKKNAWALVTANDTIDDHLENAHQLSSYIDLVSSNVGDDEDILDKCKNLSHKVAELITKINQTQKNVLLHPNFPAHFKAYINHLATHETYALEDIITDPLLTKDTLDEKNLIITVSQRFDSHWPLVDARAKLRRFFASIKDRVNSVNAFINTIPVQQEYAALLAQCQTIKQDMLTLQNKVSAIEQNIILHPQYNHHVELYEQHQEHERQLAHERELERQRREERERERVEREKEREKLYTLLHPRQNAGAAQ